MIINYIVEDSYHYCLHAFVMEEILKCYIQDCFKINDKQRIIMPKKSEYVKFKYFEIKIKSPFMIYADSESNLIPEDNRKQNANESYSNKYQRHDACSYGCKLLCADDKFSKSLKSYLGEDTIYNFISSIIKESKYCSDVMDKHFNSTKCWICDNNYIDGDVKVRDHCHTTGKYRGSAYRNRNINVNLNHKTPL